MGEQLELMEPCMELREAYLSLTEDYLAAGEEQYRERRDRTIRDFAGLICQWQDAANGQNLPPGQIQQQTWWLVRSGQEIVGTAYLRPEADADRECRTGHVGYYIRPSERGKGYGTVMLRLAVDRLRAGGVTSIAVVCSKGNPASRRVVEKCGGRLVSERLVASQNKIHQLYRIEQQDFRP